MKLYNLTLITLFSLLIGFSFSSCERHDDHIVRGDFNFETNPVPYTDRNGNLEVFFDLSSRDIIGYSPSREELLDIDVYNSLLTISSNTFRVGDMIDVYLEANGIAPYSVRLRPNIYGVMTLDGVQDPDLSGFMYDFLYLMRNNGGGARLYVTLVTGIRQSFPIYIGVENRLDLLVRD